jgi:hypothetical protein
MAHRLTSAAEDELFTVPVARWLDGSTVQSVLLPGADHMEHEYWLVRDGQVLARFASLADVDAWQAQLPAEGHQLAA